MAFPFDSQDQHLDPVPTDRSTLTAGALRYNIGCSDVVSRRLSGLGMFFNPDAIAMIGEIARYTVKSFTKGLTFDNSLSILLGRVGLARSSSLSLSVADWVLSNIGFVAAHSSRRAEKALLRAGALFLRLAISDPLNGLWYLEDDSPVAIRLQGPRPEERHGSPDASNRCLREPGVSCNPDCQGSWTASRRSCCRN